MQRIFNITKWSRIPSGQAMKFAGDKPRKIVLEVNAPVASELVYIDHDGSSHFLARVLGRDTVEFYTPGAFGLAASGSDVWIYTADGDGITFEATDPASFTVVRERRERNYELEVIAAKLSENMNRRMEQQAHELARILAARAAPLSPPAGATGGVEAPAGGADDGRKAGKPPRAGKPGKASPAGDSDPDQDE